MAFSFSESPSYLFTSESVTDGHPDKLCDQISDALLDEFLRIDPMARVACEVCITTGLVVVMGEITLSQGYVDIPAVVRQTLKEAGYVDSSYGFDYQSCGIVVSIHDQSRDISSGVSKSLEVRGGTVTDYEVESLGAGDQGMMVGYACDETAELMPLPIALAHRLCQRMAEARKQGHIPYLRPDGKSQVTVEYKHGAPKRVHTVVLSSQHSPEASQPDIERDLVEHVAKEVIPEELLDGDTRYVVNPSGRFVHRAVRWATRASRAGRSWWTPTAGSPATAGAPSQARTRPRWTDRRPTPPGTSPRTSWPRGWRPAWSSRSPTP